MFNSISSSSRRRENEETSGSIYNLLSNDNNLNHNGIDQRYSDQNQLYPQVVISNIMIDDSDEENDDTEEVGPMDITEAIDPARISMSHISVQPTLDSLTSFSSPSPSNFPIYGHTSVSSNTTYQPKCARSTASSADRYRQWQILGGGFGENYDILAPEEEEYDEESQKESEEENDFADDLSSFLDTIISVHVRRQLNKDEKTGATCTALQCNCLRPDCRIKQHLVKNAICPSSTIKDVNQTPLPRQVPILFPFSEISTNPISSNNLSDKSSKSVSAASTKMLNLVLRQNNNLNLTPESTSEPESHVHTKLKPQHHTTYAGRSSQVISQCQKQYEYQTNKKISRSKRENDSASCCPMPDLPEACSIELRKAHEDIIRRAGGIHRVKQVYHELAFLSQCLGGWQTLLENSPKDGNSLLMWLCCQPHKTQLTDEGRKIRGVRLDINRYLYSKIIAVTMAMIWDAYGNDTKDIKNTCLLFKRNSQEELFNTSLELAALTNKSVVARWIALLYPCFGRDVNETNELGHTVLHFLARKGDQVADTLQELLKLRNPSGNSSSVPFGRMFRIDVVNGGAKTPLDVAMACERDRKDDTNDTQYTQVISYFHDVIVEEAEEFEK